MNLENVNILFIIVCLILIGSAVHGYRKGFLRIAISLVSFVLTIMVVTVISPYISNYLINHTPVYDQLRQKVVEVFAEDNAKLDNSIPENQKITIENYNLPDIVKNSLVENNTEEVYQTLLVHLFEDYVSGYLSRMIINAITFIGSFIMLWILINVVLLSADFISRIPIIKGFNKMIGATAGLLWGLLIVWILFFVAIVFFGNTLGNTMILYINESKFLTILFNNDFLFKYISGI
ncbi:MAG: hypothetical protein GX567_16465 [Clostridia bacterium]|nr:hypothetical protein [Clostridia bacterium]